MNHRLARVVAVVLIAALAVGGQVATTKGAAGSSGSSSSYVVQPGDTLSSIASRYGTTVKAIASTNGIRNPHVIVIGRRLTIPAASSSSGHPRGVLPAKLQAHPDRLALRPVFEKWAAHYGVPASLLEAVAWIESGWQTGVVSKTGAIGVGQLQAATVETMQRLIGINLDPWSANDNIRMSARFLRYLLDRTGNEVAISLAAYYQGLRAVTTGPVLPQTMRYVADVLAVQPSFA